MKTSQHLTLIRLEAAGFAIGSLFFVGGAAVAQLLPADAMKANLLFVVGALCFTFGAALQLWFAYLSQVTADGKWKLRAALRNPDWLASFVQLLGTLYFNVMTFRALLIPIVTQEQGNHLIWHPDVYGSVLFLVSSLIAWHPIARQRRHAHVQRRSVWICQANLYGSIAFMVAVVGAFFLPDGQPWRPELANIGTLVGGVFFFIGAVLLLPRWDRTSDRPTGVAAGTQTAG